ncbi:MAG: hypothetical protein ABIJ09_06450 [Pseudomonadota bacterium]
MKSWTWAIFVAAAALIAAAVVFTQRSSETSLHGVEPPEREWPAEPPPEPLPRPFEGFEPQRPAIRQPLQRPSRAASQVPLNRTTPIRGRVQEPWVQRQSSPSVERREGSLSYRFAPGLAPVQAGCLRAGSFEVTQPRLDAARLRLSACRGTASACAGSGGNWVLARVCPQGRSGVESCTDLPAFVDYGHFSLSSWMELGSALARPGRYDVHFCDAGCAQAPSEVHGPCCSPGDCTACQGDIPTACPGPFTGPYAFAHLNWIEVELEDMGAH